jgi:ABC-type iron transport system FetAB ATPase subunit
VTIFDGMALASTAASAIVITERKTMQASLRVRGLRRTRDGVSLMPALNLDAGPGTVTFLTGPSGCGKSTALRAIANLDEPDAPPPNSLPIVALGERTPDSNPVAWRADVIYVQQARIALTGSPAGLFDAARGFAVRCGSGAAIARGSLEAFLQCVKEVGLTEAQMRQDWTELSGGQAQRAALAVAMALRPAVLLLDEATSACDRVSAEKVEAAVARQCIELNTIVIWVSHDGHQPGRVGGLGVPTTSMSFPKSD